MVDNLVTTDAVKALLQESTLPNNKGAENQYELLVDMAIAQSPTTGRWNAKDDKLQHERQIDTKIGHYIRTRQLRTIDQVNVNDLVSTISKEISRTAEQLAGR